MARDAEPCYCQGNVSRHVAPLTSAASQVVVTERERRDSEIEHRRILEECKRVMDDYRATERKLRSHIVKSRCVPSTSYQLPLELSLYSSGWGSQITDLGRSLELLR